jgi:hypothetical protein
MILKYLSESPTNMMVGRRQKVYEIRFEVTNWTTRHISTVVDAVKSYIKSTFKKNANRMQFLINAELYKEVDHPTTHRPVQLRVGWSWGKWCDVHDLFIAYNLDSVGVPKVRRLNLEIRAKVSPDNARTAGRDEHNDCVFNAIYQALNFKKELLPKKINSARKFKLHFKVDRDDEVPIFDIVEELQNLLKISIIIVGDKTYTPTEIKARNITLKYSNNHVTLVNNAGKGHIAATHFKEVSKDDVISYSWDDDSIVTFDGKRENHVSSAEFEEMVKDGRMYLYEAYQEPLKETLKERREKYFRMADYFKEKTNGLINLYKDYKMSRIAFDLWRKTSKSIAEPEPIEVYEHEPLVDANIGGVHWYQAGTFEHCTDYDINMMYMYYMSTSTFQFPTRKPDEVKHITTKELNEQPFFKFGLYKCKIIGSSIWLPPKYSKDYNWVTQYILTIAKEEGLRIEMYDSDETNAMLYTSNRLNGDKTFGEYRRIVEELRTTAEGTEFQLESKRFSSCLWGYMCSRNKKKQTFNKDDEFNLDDYDMKELRPNADGGYRMTHFDKVEKLKFSYGRIGAFLTTFCRYQLYKLVKKLNIKDSDIVVLNTDSFCVRGEISVPKALLGSESGKLKIGKKKGVLIENVTVCVENSNHYHAVSK